MAIVSLGRHGNGAAQNRAVKTPQLVLHIELGRRAMYQAAIVPHHLGALHGAVVCSKYSAFLGVYPGNMKSVIAHTSGFSIGISIGVGGAFTIFLPLFSGS